MTYQYSFKDCLQRAERITWRVEDLIGGDKKLDFSRPFMPESYARTAELEFLSADEKRTLNQIRGHAYLAMFGLVEEFILPFVLDHAQPMIIRPMQRGDDYRARAYLEFASEEAKHIHLFRRFAEEFRAGFPIEVHSIGPARDIAAAVLDHDPLSVALLILGIEWMTQAHYTESVRDDAGLDPQFKSLLKHHWMEEMQHAQIDAILVDALGRGRDKAGIDAAVDGYLDIGGFFDKGLEAQAKLDLDALERSTGQVFTEEERAEILRVQHQALRWTYVGSGLVHPQFRAALDRLGHGARERLDQVAPVFG
jgi:hypothetical protein